jgi:threonine/homoserine/homoserine lactone efflux protein
MKLMLQILFKGIIIGLIVGMPLGPIGAICIKTTLSNGVSFGIAAGLGSCAADSIYAGVAALGLTFIISITNYKRYTTPIYVHLKLFEKILHINPHRFIR